MYSCHSPWRFSLPDFYMQKWITLVVALVFGVGGHAQTRPGLRCRRIRLRSISLKPPIGSSRWAKKGRNALKNF